MVLWGPINLKGLHQKQSKHSLVGTLERNQTPLFFKRWNDLRQLNYVIIKNLFKQCAHCTVHSSDNINHERVNVWFLYYLFDHSPGFIWYIRTVPLWMVITRLAFWGHHKKWKMAHSRKTLMKRKLYVKCFGKQNNHITVVLSVFWSVNYELIHFSSSSITDVDVEHFIYPK